MMITGKLRSCGAAKREIVPGVEHRSHKGQNDRAENSHRPIRQRIMKLLESASPQRELRATAVETWHQIAHLNAA
jgi:putative transposase